MKKTLSVLVLGILIGVGTFVSFTKADTIETFLTDISAKTLGLRIGGDVAFEKSLYVGDKVGIGTANPTEKLTVDGVIETSGGIKFGDGSVQETANLSISSKQNIIGDGNTTIDWNLGNSVDFTFGALNENFTFINPTSPDYLTLKLKQDSVGSRLASFNTSINWENASEPVLSTGGTQVDLISLYFDGENYYEAFVRNNLRSIISSTHSSDFEASNSQYLSISDENLSSGFPGKSSDGHSGASSVEMWIKIESLASELGHNVQFYTKYNNAANKRSISLQQYTADNSLIVYYSGDGINTTFLRTTETFTSSDKGKWVHLSWCIDVANKTGTVYKNGVAQTLAYQSGTQTSMHLNDSPVHIGANITPAGFFDGKMSEVRVFSKLLSASEVEENYKKRVISQPALQAAWTLNNTLTDYSGNDNTLTNNNSVSFSEDVPY